MSSKLNLAAEFTKDLTTHGHRLLPARRPAHRRGARGPRPGPGLRRRRGAADHQRLLGAGRVPVRAGAQAGRARHRRRRRSRATAARACPASRAGMVDPGDVPRRRQRQHLPRRAVRPGDGLDQHARQRGAEAALAARHGHAGQDRRVRADRTGPRLRLRRAGDHRPPRRRRLGAQRRQAVDRQRAASPTSSSCGPGTRRTARSRASSWRRTTTAAYPDGLHRRADHRQDRQAGHLAAGHHAARRAGPGGQQARRGATRSATSPGCSPRPAAARPGSRSVTPSPRTRSRSTTPRSAASSASRSPSFQLVQDKLAKMLAEITAMQLICFRMAQLQEQGR